VLQLIAEGHINKEIAAVLDLSVNTIHAHRNSVMAKLNLHKQTDLVRYAIKAGMPNCRIADCGLNWEMYPPSS